ncbi:MAG: hypothetical protein A2341_12125 [Deltaproteobacteria bacterium RIFOXYB12_FULL_58_9]|nr:MAG: hypothetical protein A2341_12125 [Deltaproteobacteria bacterium RIFOXYB12_FULL_58_9]
MMTRAAEKREVRCYSGAATGLTEETLNFAHFRAVTSASGSASYDLDDGSIRRDAVDWAVTQLCIGTVDWAQIPLRPGDATLRQIRSLSRRASNWDTHGAVAVDSGGIENAQSWLRKAIEAVGEKQWAEPLVTASADGDVVLEWWGAGQKKLTIYVAAQLVEYVRVWGKDIHEEMDDGQVEDPASFVSLWQWLHGG